MLELDDYIASHSSAEPECLRLIAHRAHQQTVHPRMVSGHVQGRVLASLSRMLRPRRVLEIGTFVGYSALCLAEGVEEGGEVVTIEKNDELEDIIHENLASSPYGERVHLEIGGAEEVLPRLQGVFDLVFLDADKRRYLEDLQAVLPLLRSDGWILADNTLWDGHIADPAYDGDPQTEGLRRFNDYVATSEELECVILPLRDGLSLIRKK